MSISKTVASRQADYENLRCRSPALFVFLAGVPDPPAQT